MTGLTLETSAIVGRVQPPAYERPDTPVSAWSRWTIVHSSLVDFGEQLACRFGESSVAEATAVANARQEWEVQHSLVSVQMPGVQADRAQREASAADLTGEIPPARKFLDIMGEVVDWMRSRRDLIPRARDPFAQYRQHQEEVELQQHLATAPPEFTDEALAVVAATALAAQATNGPDAVQLGAADVLYTEFPQIVVAAHHLVEAGTPAVQ